VTNAPAPPPGWYPDPSGIPRQVYWDGQNWHIPPPPKTSRTRWVVIGVVVGLVILGWVVSAVALVCCCPTSTSLPGRLNRRL
jgi:hypothetical protein